MIYETAFVLKPSCTDDSASKIKDAISSLVSEHKGEILVNDDWGLRTFAQPTSKGETKGKFYYVMFSADGTFNAEIDRKMKLSEDVLKWMTVSLGPEAKKDQIVKSYKNPNHEVTDKDRIKSEKEKKISSKTRSCWFSANKTQPDWKDPSTYKWLVNEFGKISPGRATGLRPRYQRMATTAIKRARTMGMISYQSNKVSYKVQ